MYPERWRMTGDGIQLLIKDKIPPPFAEMYFWCLGAHIPELHTKHFKTTDENTLSAVLDIKSIFKYMLWVPAIVGGGTRSPY